MEKRSDEVEGIFHEEIQEETVYVDDPYSLTYIPRQKTVTKKIITVEVTDKTSSSFGKILPIQSRYGQLKKGDEVLFQIVLQGKQQVARLVHCPTREKQRMVTVPGQKGRIFYGGGH